MNNWFKQIWFEFRMGHTTYLVLFLSFGTFATVQYKLLFQNISFINELIPNMVTFILVFIMIYLPVSILIGHLHLRKQVPIESIRLTEESPLTYGVLKQSKDLFNIKYRIFEIGMFEQLVKEIMPSSEKKVKLLAELLQWKEGWKKISEGVSTKELMK